MHSAAIYWTLYHGPDPLTATLDELRGWRSWMAICFPDGWEPEADPVLTRAERLDEAAWLDAHGLHDMAADVLAGVDPPASSARHDEARMAA